MILRRLTKHVKDQNWFAVGLDFVIVVVGILLAFQITNWAGARSQAEQHQRYYQRLQSDFSTIDERIDSQLEFFEKTIAGTTYILDVIRLPDEGFSPDDIDRPRFVAALEALGSSRIPLGRSATYTEMVSAGQLSEIRNETLRDRLSDYDRFTAINLEVWRATFDQLAPQIPITLRHMRRGTIENNNDVTGFRTVVLSYDIAAMRADPEFEIAVTIMVNTTSNNLGVRRIEKALSAKILALVSEEIDK